MITDTTLTVLCNSLGGVVMALIFAYHFVVINSKDNSNNSKSKDKNVSEPIKENKTPETSKEKKLSEPSKEKKRVST
ncbi:5234_t:CDS:2 [Funneliformis caledonium]|uniref:5234_t:CDS:1 n=1 Tax=Funneliformis caledonium TaxID=1117310 RepID=A0A9N8WDS1_9GLOM|nr:5234_t:CDS:2 [Funneliformis caledonium]